MKKVLVLALVLGIASMASATLSYSPTAITMGLNSTATVTISADSADMYEVWAGADTSDIAEITAVSAYDAAGEDASGTASAYAGWWILIAKDLDPDNPPDVAAGDHWDVTISSGSTTGTITLDSACYSGGGTIDVTVIPEPITVALLGLGGLFLRRRK